MILRQLFDADTCTYTYLIGDEKSGHAALIDPVREQLERDLTLIEELGLSLRLVLDTHVHADHVTAAGMLRERTGATTCASDSGASCIDKKLADGDVLVLGATQIEALATPGHTDDSMSFRVEGAVFTGDALFIRGTGRTDFQNGDPEDLYRSITERLFTLPEDTRVFPGHDYRGQTMSTIGEEKRLNPRVAGKSQEEFVAIMQALDLAPPKHLHEAVPLNQGCGMATPQVQG